MNYDKARKNLIEQNIRPCNVYDPDAIKSLYRVPRESFVPYKYKNYAFSDFQVPLNKYEFMPSPVVEARIFQSVLTKTCGEILEIGCGSGYMAALLAQIYKSVITLEINQTFIEQAYKNIKSNKISNVQIFQGDGLNHDSRWSNKKFDAIVISGGIKNIPLFLKDSIHINGKIVAFMNNGPLMNVVMFKKNHSSGFLKTTLFETKINYLRYENSTGKFQF
jgi:protein-L-isoaspartate(D-aspartate) O-methyltransferase